jgi:succinate dehydrogenase / fumarate reductase, cytochrome b subunit
VLDVHSMVVAGFQNVIVSAFYIVAVGLLSFHLVHGVDSMFQTLGLRNSRWGVGLRRASLLLAVLYFLGNLAIPAAILAGKVQLRPGVELVASTPAGSHTASR